MADCVQFTDRQESAWPDAIAEAQQYVTSSTVPTELVHWTVQWGEEVRPGRGHDFNGLWLDGEYLVDVYMGVYGFPVVTVAELDVLHSGSDEDCQCDPCVKERAGEAGIA